MNGEARSLDNGSHETTCCALQHPHAQAPHVVAPSAACVRGAGEHRARDHRPYLAIPCLYHDLNPVFLKAFGDCKPAASDMIRLFARPDFWMAVVS